MCALTVSMLHTALSVHVFLLVIVFTSGAELPVRLVVGPSPREGRLEIHHSGRWGTVCNDGFRNTEARVVCYMLGYGYVGHYISNYRLPSGGPIWLDNIRCRGTETSLENCRHNGWGVHDCGHNDVVSIACSNEVVRLVGDSGSRGRLEVYHNGTWGTVCDNGFTDAAAKVVCYFLGYGHTGRFIGNQYGGGGGRIWLDNVRCRRRETSITGCQHNGWGSHNCSHSDDVSVSCIADSAEAVALVGGGSPRVGRLEVFHGTQWGTVCDDGFTDAAARVVCYSLGFGYVGRKVDINLYNVGDGLVWLSNIHCTGTEQYIGECSHSDWGFHNCSAPEHQHVAVSCTDNTSATNVNDPARPVTPVRLAGGSSSAGRLEVLHNGLWGTVCGDVFTIAATQIACKMLGFQSGLKIDNRNYTTDEGPIWLDDVRCNGTETDIAECTHQGWGIHNCQHREDVAVSCSRTEVEVRLNGGRDPREGRLEVLYSDVWRSVCSGGLNSGAAKVVCNMLGFENIGQLTGHVDTPELFSVNSVRCTGTEKNVAECDINDWSVCDGHESEFGNMYELVSCLAANAVALMGSGNPREGRLEVYHNGVWGTVCDDGFTDAAARVVCYSLGFGYDGREVNIDKYGTGKGKTWLDDVHCKGTERHIGECSHGGWGVHNCKHYEDVAISCTGESPTISKTTISPPTAVNSTQSGSSQDALDSTHVGLIIAVVVVGCLLLIVCVSVVGIVAHCRRNRRQERTEEVVIPMTLTLSSNNKVAFDDTIRPKYENLASNTLTQASYENLYSNLQERLG